MITWVQWGFQGAQSPLMEELLYLHDFLFLILSFIFVSAIWIFFKSVSHIGIKKSLISHNFGECLRVIYPAAVLFQIGVGSLALLYILDETTIASQVSLKTIRHQWYWAYEYRDRWSGPCQLLFDDSYIIPSREIKEGGPRLLEVNNRAPLPYGVVVRSIIRSADVLHSWALPWSGVKVDGNPGQTLSFQPNNILHMRGRDQILPALTGDYWAGIEHNELDPENPAIRWYLASVPCANFEGTGLQGFRWTTSLIRSYAKEDVHICEGQCLSSLCSGQENHNHSNQKVLKVPRDQIHISRDKKHYLIRGTIENGTKYITPTSRNVLTFSTKEPCFLISNAYLSETSDDCYSTVFTGHPDHNHPGFIDTRGAQAKFAEKQAHCVLK